MSRLIVKNLPSTVTCDKLKSTFSGQGGLVTDVQLKYTKEGKFRHFAFVGFKSEEEAGRAKKYFNGTFVGATKISVEVAADLGDSDKPRAWSKYAPDSSAYKATHQEEEEAKQQENKSPDKKKKKKGKKLKKEVDELLSKYKDDQKFQEFLSVHQNASSGKSWDNQDILDLGKEFEGTNEEEEEEVEEEKEKCALQPQVSDLDYLKSKKTSSSTIEEKVVVVEKAKKDFFTIKLAGLPYKAKKKDIKKFFSPLTLKSVRVPQKIKGIAYVGFATEKARNKAIMTKNKSFMGTTQIRITRYDNLQVKEGHQNEKRAEWEQAEKATEGVAESGRLFVRNLSYSVTEEDLEGLFKPFGPLTEVHLPVDRLTRQIKGFAFVTFVLPENAVQAFTKLDGSAFQGRTLHLIPGKAKLEDSQEEEEEEGQGKTTSSFKKAKAAKEKATAGSSHNWNTLFLGTSAVADLMAEQYGVDKRDVLLSEGHKKDSSAAVRLALGETQIVEDTRAFLESQGVALEAFEQDGKKASVKRSNKVIVVKNLPAFTSAMVIRNLFAKHGELGRVVMPPRGGVTALVEFLAAPEAKTAFKALAYTRFKSTPLYLEWAPENAFKEDFVPNDNVVTVDEGETKAKRTLFVKNLNFDTTDGALRQHFEGFGLGVVSASVALKKDLRNPTGPSLSMGYGFVQFESSGDADNALKTVQHKLLDGHSLELKRSDQNRSADVKKPRGMQQQQGDVKEEDKSTKIIARNVPFEATEAEVKSLFATFGQLKGVRLPKKATGSHRGFAFVEFLTKEEAKKAFDKLKHSTHLYGRRLVLEWAAQEETVEDLRKRTATHFVGSDVDKKRAKKAEIMEAVMMAAPSK